MDGSQSILLPPPESALIPLIREFGKDYFGRRFHIPDLDSEIEINSGFGIADVVFFKFDSEIIEKRKDRSIQPIQSERVLKTLLLLRNRKKVSLTYLSHALPFSSSELKYKVLPILERQNLLSKISPDCYEIVFQYEIGLRQSIAIEAKIKDWQRGLYQAYRYKWFSEVSYLAIYEDFIEQPKRKLALFKKLNVGLMGVGRNNVRVLFNPLKEKVRSRYMNAVAFERLLAKAL
jgi:hypothetical protein